MPFGDYDHGKIIKAVQKRHKKGETLRHKEREHKTEIEHVKLAHAKDKLELQRFQSAEKRKQAAAKKAAATRAANKKGAKK